MAAHFDLAAHFDRKDCRTAGLAVDDGHIPEWKPPGFIRTEGPCLPRTARSREVVRISTGSAPASAPARAANFAIPARIYPSVGCRGKCLSKKRRLDEARFAEVGWGSTSAAPKPTHWRQPPSAPLAACAWLRETPLLLAARRRTTAVRDHLCSRTAIGPCWVPIPILQVRPATRAIKSGFR